MRWLRGDVCEWWGRRKRKGRVYMGGGEIKKEKEMGSGVYVYGGKNVRVEKKEGKKKIEKEKTKFVLFICSLYLV
jgi:hypothetical protein